MLGTVGTLCFRVFIELRTFLLAIISLGAVSRFLVLLGLIKDLFKIRVRTFGIVHEQLIEYYEMNIYLLKWCYLYLKLLYEIDLRLYFIVSVLNTTNPRIPAYCLLWSPAFPLKARSRHIQNIGSKRWCATISNAIFVMLNCVSEISLSCQLRMENQARFEDVVISCFMSVQLCQWNYVLLFNFERRIKLASKM